MFKRLFLCLAGVSLFAGCGGGGSSPGVTPAYTGVTTQATVTASNAKALSADAYSGSQISSATTGVAKTVAGNDGQSPLLPQAAGILERSVATIVGSHKSSAKAAAATVPYQSTAYGYGGSYSFSITANQSTGAFNGSVTFSQYQESALSPTVSGPMTFSGVYNQSAGTFTSLNISLGGLTGIDGGSSYRMVGEVSYSTNGTARTIGMSVVLTDNATGRTYWVKDYTLTETGTSITLTGTYYDPLYGYVVISTVTPLTASAVDATPTSGQLLFSGSNGTKGRLTFTSSSSTIEVDAAGTGSYVIVP